MRTRKKKATGLYTVVADFVGAIKERMPEAKIEISYQPYETEDANLHVYCPERYTSDECQELAIAMAERHARTLLDDGFSVLVLVFEPPERVKRENEEYFARLKQQAS